MDEGEWVKEDPGTVGSNIPSILHVDFSEDDKLRLENVKTALEYYELFQSDEWLSDMELSLGREGEHSPYHLIFTSSSGNVLYCTVLYCTVMYWQ